MENEDSETQEQPGSSTKDATRAKQDVSSKPNKRELSSKRPYRKKTQNEMLSDVSVVTQTDAVKQEVEEEAAGDFPTTVYQTDDGQYIAFTPGGAFHFSDSGAEGMQVMQPLTMSNTGAPQSDASTIQYATQSSDGGQQYYMSGNKMMVPEPTHSPQMLASPVSYNWPPAGKTASGDMSAYQLHTPTSSMPQGEVTAGSPGSLESPQHEGEKAEGEKATRKRQLRLLKNRDAAKECRRRKREYVRSLETRLDVLEMQNKHLMEEHEYFKKIWGPYVPRSYE